MDSRLTLEAVEVMIAQQRREAERRRALLRGRSGRRKPRPASDRPGRRR
jgi:hypothetical protein